MESQKVEGSAAAGQGKGKVFKAASFLGAAVVGGSLIGGGTLALWNDTVETDSYDIQAGTMAIEQIGGMTLTDITLDGFTNGNVLDRDNFKVSPGQKIQVEQQFDIALDGTDLYASVDTQKLSAALVAASTNDAGEPFAEIDNVQFTDASGEVLTSEGTEYHFASSDSPSKDEYETNTQTTLATQNAPGETIDGTPELVVTYDVEFTDVDDLEGAGETLASLNSVDLTLNQRATW